MTFLVNKLVDLYNYSIIDLADSETNQFLFISSPWPVLAITGFYLYFCTSFGPRYMRDRKPYDLQKAVLFYNLFQVAMSAFLFTEGVSYMSSKKFDFRCDPVDYSNEPRALRAKCATWWYFFAKITELLDTIFFVLRKKNNHVSFLHVYHHSLMIVMVWIGVKYIPGGHAVVMGTLNTFVHVVMYTYYLIAGLGPQYQKYIWWKKYVTVLQLAQFVVIAIHNIIPLFSECSYPKLTNLVMLSNSILFLHLFGQFFYNNYIKINKSVKMEQRRMDQSTKEFITVEPQMGKVYKKNTNTYNHSRV